MYFKYVICEFDQLSSRYYFVSEVDLLVSFFRAMCLACCIIDSLLLCSFRSGFDEGWNRVELYFRVQPSPYWSVSTVNPSTALFTRTAVQHQ